MLATPAYSGLTIQYTQSLAIFINQCARQRPEIEITPLFLSLAVLHRSRNLFASRALNDGFSHIVFIDSDIGFQPSAVVRLLDANLDVCGCLCPQRSLADEAFYTAARDTPNALEARKRAQRFVSMDQLLKTEHNGRAGYAINNGFVRTQSIGMGLTCIRVDALQKLVDRFPELLLADKRGPYSNYPQVRNIYTFFDPISRQGHDTLDEDVAFCYRWSIQYGGQIHALLDEEITHVGEGVFTGVALDRMMQGPL